MKKLLSFILLAIALTAVAQTISKRVNIYHGIKDSEGYECLTATIENKDTTMNFWVMNDNYFPAEDPIYVFNGVSIKKAKSVLNKYLDIAEKLDADMEYTDKKTKFYMSKKVYMDNDTVLFISTDLVKFHKYRPRIIRQVINEIDEFSTNPQYRGPMRRYIN